MAVAESGGYAGCFVEAPGGSWSRARRRQLRSKEEPGGRTDMNISGQEKQKLQQENAVAARTLELVRRVEKRGGATSVIGPRSSWWWAHRPTKSWLEEGDEEAIAHLELCGWCPEKRESVWAGSLPGIQEEAEKNRCRHSRGEHGRAPGAESGQVPLPAGFYGRQVELLERWYSTGRALPERSKPRAWPRTPWETAFGELVEVVQFKQLLNGRTKVEYTSTG